MLRIIAGDAKRKPLKVPTAVSRPTTDRVRENIFNLIYDLVQESLVLDLFAGSGAMGLEAASRGAKRVTFVEQDRGACRTIQENIKKTELSPYCQVSPQDVTTFLKNNRQTYDLIFADPPYWKKAGDPDHVAALLSNQSLQDALEDDGYLLIEQFEHAAIHQPDGWKLIENRKYGSCCVLLYQIDFE